MNRNQEIKIKQLGNVLQITLEIPWNKINGENTWKSYFENKPPEGPRPDYWGKLTERVLSIYKKTGNISKTAKESGAGYYITDEIIRKNQSKIRKNEREETKKTARKLADDKVPIKEIAVILGKSKETVRLWLNDK